ncbi:protein (fungal and plant) [Pochonia chlamydosporia 170]|uniref:Protein (Fungal and plant) n=1 Tax=Pochonia chlamydosporia 170 TaxID=1380566 RepID=A0A179G073_METCM|nr:protein (fungal and plant) [Pochonia chlamydosporia 170]OAQ70761.1 protein (fungal and plant) [Pochonia chlamydosporia 170]
MAKGQDTAAQPQRRRQWKLPAWLNHFNLHDGKIVLRCWVAAWVGSLLMFIQPTLTNMGLAAFFALLVLVAVPPASILLVYLLASLSLLLGMCFGWAWGLLTMKAALAARPEAETQQSLKALQQTAAAQANQTGQPAAWEAQVLVHEGFMLDARVTTVFYVMSCVFIYALCRIRMKNAKFVLLQLFGIISVDIFLLIGPTLPTFTADLGTVLVKPAAVGIALGSACCLIFFPQSTSYAVLEKMEKLVLLQGIAVSTTKKRLGDDEVSVTELVEAKGKTMALYKAMEPALAFLPLDFSRGRWNAEDVKGLQARVRDIMTASLSLVDFHISRIKVIEKEEKLEQHHNAEEKKGLDKPSIGRHQMQESSDLLHALRSPELGEVRDRTKAALFDTTAEVLQVCSESIKSVAKCISTVNRHRWIGQPSAQSFDELAQELQTELDALRSSRDLCITNTTEKVLDTHRDLFDAKGELKSPGDGGARLLRGIVVAMVIEERIIGMATAIEKLLEYVLHLMNTRKTHRIWVPLRIRYAFTWLLDGRLSVPVSGTTTDAANDPDSTTDPVLLHDQAEEAHRRLRVSRGDYVRPRKKSAVTRALMATFRWLFNPAGLYALRMVIVTVATAIPAAIPSSAGFFYREKGIWGVISAQTCLLPYMADFTFSVVSRGLGTVIGGVMGMVAWYIGSGSGVGNPYGLGAISALMILILLWWRIFLPPAFAQASIMAGATYALVVGFSYDHYHITQYGLPGVGYEAFWKRLVTVLLGFLASCIVQLFPKPPSAANHVCKTLSNTVGTLADHYALLLSHWGLGQQNSPLSTVAEQISLDVAETLVSLDGAIALLKMEPSFGHFDQYTLRETQKLCLAMNQCLGRLLDLSSSLPKEHQDRFSNVVGFLDDHVIGDIMAVLGVVRLSLKTGAPLPERLPAPLIRNFYTWWHDKHRTAMLSTSLIRNENYRRYCVAVSAYLRFLSAVDDLVLVVKGAVGECHVVRQWDDV